MIGKFKYANLIILLGSVFTFVFLPTASFASHTPHIAPKRANYFLGWSIDEKTAHELARWDLLILDMEIQVSSLASLKKIRELNPNIKILAYIAPQEVQRDVYLSGSVMRVKLMNQLSSSWFLTNSFGSRLSWWPGSWIFNVTDQAPVVRGQRLNQVIPKFVANEVLATGLWDGVFYDNAWDNITWFVGNDIDLNRDGLADTNLDLAWQAGMRFIYNETRRLAGSKFIIVGNSDARVYRNELNGMMLENFRPENWTRLMQAYEYNQLAGDGSKVNIINANTANRGGEKSYQAMRFGLTSALLLDGYYSFDFGDQDHGQLWWYDEYNLDLGPGNGPASAYTGKKDFAPDVWQRDYDHGLALVNSTNKPQTVSLAGDYEKIIGSQDKIVNNGAIVSETTIPAEDGLVLLKTLSTLNDVVFSNGAFVRFSNSTGERVRNGFFVFEEKRNGGDLVAHIDLDGNGKRDLLVVEKNRVMAWRDDGQPLINIYPYTASFGGSIKLAVGDLDDNGLQEIIVSPGSGYPAPIKIYSAYGSQLLSDWFPFGLNYKGGYSLAVGNVDARFSGAELVIGSGTGVEPQVRVYERWQGFQFRLATQWLAFEKSFRGGVDVAVGNTDGEGLDEVVVGAGPGKAPVVRVFSGSGKQVQPEFRAYKTFGQPGVEVEVADVNFDGIGDIVSFGNAF